MARCVRVAVLIGVAVTIAESWVVQVLALVDETEWDLITRSSRTAGFTLFVAYVVWELFKYPTDPYMARKNKNAADAIVDGDAAAAPASRISTMMPLLRGTAAVLIAHRRRHDRARILRREHHAADRRRLGLRHRASRSAARRW